MPSTPPALGLSVLLTLLALSGRADAQVPPGDGGPSTIFFDNEGAENGITVQGTTDFSIFGANWTDGLVISVGVPNLYGSVPAAYQVPAGNTVTVTFDEPVDAATFFFVTESLTPSTATAFDASGTPIGSVESPTATFLADPANFLTLDPEADMARIEFDGGWIDNFTFGIVGDPPPPPPLLSIVLGDKVIGELGPAGTQLLRFDAAAGMQVSFKVSRKTGGFEPALRLTDPCGVELVSAAASVVSEKKAAIAKQEVLETGEHMLEILDLTNQGGTYKLTSKRSLPKTPKQIVEVAPDLGPVCVPLDAVVGTTLKKLLLKSMKPKGDFAMTGGEPAALLPRVLAIHAPGLGPLDLAGLVVTSTSGTKVSVAGVELPVTGTFLIEIDGSGGSVGFASLVMKLRVPKGKTTHE